ncbi:MAG: hypothetical protein FJW40_26495 [Acidobacteria bacterium]|nr:hypothetical protein [Acidobacteriota bacterium]
MLPEFLVPESIVRENGAGPAVALEAARGRVLELTLGITRIIEQESLDVTIHGSCDGVTFDSKPLLSFPQKFYCGTYIVLLNLTAHPEISHLQVRWKVHRWGHGDPKPLFGFYLFANEQGKTATAGVPG